jgi:hypothetical protein
MMWIACGIVETARGVTEIVAPFVPFPTFAMANAHLGHCNGECKQVYKDFI